MATATTATNNQTAVDKRLKEEAARKTPSDEDGDDVRSPLNISVASAALDENDNDDLLSTPRRAQPQQDDVVGDGKVNEAKTRRHHGVVDDANSGEMIRFVKT